MNVCGGGGVAGRAHGVQLDGEDVDYACVRVVVVGKVDQGVKVVVGLGVVGVDAGDVLVFNSDGGVGGVGGLEKEGALKILPR